MRRLTTGLALAGAFALLTPRPLHANPYAPALRFETLETAHFFVHFHDEEEALARRVGALAESAHVKLVALFGHEPREKTHVILVDVEDSANGWATALPYNTIELRAAPPDSRTALHQADDWLWNLIVHEYTHVLHLDAIGGPAHLLNRLVGKSLSPNGAWPRWFTEGLAVYAESALSTGGRLRSSMFESEFRSQLLEDEPLTLQRLSHLPLDYPRLGSRYSYGGRFVDFVARKFGVGALRGIIETNARSWVPYFLGTLAEQHTGLDFDTLYLAWLAEERERALLHASTAGVDAVRLSVEGETRRTPRASPDGESIWSLVLDADSRPSLRRFDLTTLLETRVVDVNGDGTLTVLPDGRVLLSQPELVDTYRTHDDLFLVDPDAPRLKRLTVGARLSEPDASADGRIVAIRRPGPGRTELVLFDTLHSLDSPRVLHEGASTLASPRFSPDGTQVVFLEKRHGAFELRLFDLATGTSLWLTDDSSQDLTPAFDADGRVLFSSDRSGTFDVYALAPQTGDIKRLTRSRDGALEPLAIGNRLFFLQMGKQGLDLSELLAPRAEQAPPPHPPVDEPDHAPIPADGAPRRYSPLSTLYPTSRLPVLGADAQGMTLGIALAGSDVLSKWRWAASGWWGLRSSAPGFSLQVQTDVFFPTLSLHVGRSRALSAGVVPGLETVTNASVSSLWSFRRSNSVTQVQAGWNVTSLAPVATPEPSGSERAGILSTPFASIAWSNARRYTRSISTAEGRRVSLALEGGGRLTGGDFSLLRAVGTWNEYVPLPAHHVFALQLTAGVSDSSLDGRSAFALGGVPLFPSSGALLSLQSPTRVLHGYRVLASSGQALALLNAEWRFPLATLEWGWSTLPLQLRRLHGAVLADVGDAFDFGAQPFSPRLGVGAELRMEVVFGYTTATDVRLGLAQGISERGLLQFWVATGRSF